MDEAMTTDAPVVTDNVQPSTTETVATPVGNWYDGLGEGLNQHPSITKFTNQDELAKSYVGLQSMMGQDKIPVPKGADDTEAWAMYNKAFGIPETADGYELTSDQELGDLADFKQVMHQYKIPPEAANGLLNEYVSSLQQGKQMQEQQFQQDSQNAEQNLRKEWGLAYDQNISQARNYLMKVSGNEETFNYYNEKVGNDPKFIQLFSKMGESISEGELGGFEGQTTNFVKTPSEAKAEFEKVMNDPSDPFWAGSKNKRNDLKHCKAHNLEYVSDDMRKERVKYVNSLMQMKG